MMDGDRMGAILSGDDDTNTTISYLQSFHPNVQEGFAKRAAKQHKIKEYGSQKRAISPNRHLAISGALNDYFLTGVRIVEEEKYLDREIYVSGELMVAVLPVV